MSKRLFTSDLHLGHELMRQMRGFETIEEHNEEIIRRWNEEVGPDDVVFVAGDVVMGNRAANLRLFQRMHGTKHLITGNHDDCWPGHSYSWTRYKLYLEAFASVQPFLKMGIDRKPVLISHFPYNADRTDPPRYEQYRLPDRGAWLLHGHTHSSTRRTSPREIHIGMDAWGLRPVAEDRIIALMRGRQLKEKEDSANATAPTAPTASLPVPAADAERPAAASGAAVPPDVERDQAPGEPGAADSGRQPPAAPAAGYR